MTPGVERSQEADLKEDNTHADVQNIIEDLLLRTTMEEGRVGKSMKDLLLYRRIDRRRIALHTHSTV